MSIVNFIRKKPGHFYHDVGINIDRLKFREYFSESIEHMRESEKNERTMQRSPCVILHFALLLPSFPCPIKDLLLFSLFVSISFTHTHVHT